MTKATQTLALGGDVGSHRNHGLDVVKSSSPDLHRAAVMVETRSLCGGDDAMRSACTTDSRQEIPAGQPGCKDTEIPLEPMIEEAEPDDVLGSDEEDERMFPDLVQKTNEEIDEDFIPAEFSDTDSEEEQENIDMGHFENDDEDRPEMMYDRENPSLAEGVVFPSAVDCRNAVATFSIQHEVEFKIEKSDPSRFTVYCAFPRCRWRLHASLMRNSTLFQIKVNPYEHHCPSVNRTKRLKAAKRRWIADAVQNWVRENSNIGPGELVTNLKKKYGIELPYMRVFYGKQMAIDNLYGKYEDSFQLLYTFKAEVERASPGSVVEIDTHTVPFQLRGKRYEKQCFRRVFVSFKACWQGFLAGCRPYLAVDATALNGRFRGQLVAACAIDAHNWIFPVAYGVLETESKESWGWFFQNLKKVIGHPEGLVIHTDACKGLKTAVDGIYPGVEHRECMRHLAQNFSKKSRGKFYDQHLWPCSLTYSIKKHNYHLRQVFTKPKV
nr:uncharacterized protein LOC109745480 [Aegilops tauschii subsp. strangulata]